MIELSPPLRSVSERTQERLGIIRDLETGYQPNEFVLRDLAHKSLIAIVGPSSVGKSYVIDELVRTTPHFGKVLSFSTRDPRPDDTPDTMVCLPWDERHIKRICNVIEAGDAVQYIFHPKTGDIYGTTLESYPEEYNVLPALSTSVAALDELPFRSIHKVGLVAEPEIWEKWFEKREFSSTADRHARLGEAVSSLEWILSHPEVAIVNNIFGHSEQTTKTIRKFVLKGKSTPRDEMAAQALLDHIQRMQ